MMHKILIEYLKIIGYATREILFSNISLYNIIKIEIIPKLISKFNAISFKNSNKIERNLTS